MPMTASLHSAHSRLPVRMVFGLAPGEQVSCYYCDLESSRDRPSYGRGEAVLAGAAHPPYDGNANFICMRHLDDDAEISDPSNDWRMVSREEYRKQAGS